MKYSVKGYSIEIYPDDGFNLKNTFECGQCFRWDRQTDDSYFGIAHGKCLCVSASENRIILRSCSEEDYLTIWKDYFDLENDYNKIKREIEKAAPQLTEALKSIDGIRILKQEPWEALCSFIISQNNNIPRIKGIVQRLCEGFGSQTELGYSFPDADTIAKLTVEDLAPLRAGFRAKYIIDAAKKVSGGDVRLYDMYNMPIEECRYELMKIVGVGKKVAECTLLYGLHRMEAFPVDVWMRKALSSTFSGIDIEALGEYAGIAQQYIFHYTRQHPELLNTSN